MLVKLFERRWYFVCESSQSECADREFPVERSIGAFEDDTPAWFPQSMQTAFMHMNGAELFSNPGEKETGLVLYSIKAIERETTEFRDLLVESLAEDMPTETVDWYKNLVPVAAIPDSGDRFVVDLSLIRKGSEAVLFFDHECYYQGVANPDNVEEYASDYIAFLEKVVSEPLRFLQSTWRAKADGEFWFPLKAVSR
ncbi:MAG: SMI1/KNR4 family protein [Pseudomonadota bacterium]